MSRFTAAAIAVIGLLLSLQPASAEPPTNPAASFERAKVIARNQIYAGHKTDAYCGCSFTSRGASGGDIDPASCGLVSTLPRAKRLEWEHAMPAWFFGHSRSCWSEGAPQCVDSKGKAFKGRSCCTKVDVEFRHIEADLHNLLPAVGLLNGDRSNLPYGEVVGEPRAYGACNFEIDRTADVAEPPDNIRGDVARIWLYMSKIYGVTITPEQRQMFSRWSEADPVDDWERQRDARIKAIQGNANLFVAVPEQ